MAGEGANSTNRRLGGIVSPSPRAAAVEMHRTARIIADNSKKEQTNFSNWNYYVIDGR
jgi:hypothetical protein